MTNPIETLLLKAKMANQSQIQEAHAYRRDFGCTLQTALVRLGHIAEDDVLEFLQRETGRPSICLAEIDLDPAVLGRIPADLARSCLAVPFSVVRSRLHVAMADPTDRDAIDRLKKVSGLHVEVSLTTEADVRAALEKHYPAVAGSEGKAMLKELLEKGLDDAEPRASKAGSSDDSFAVPDNPLGKTLYTILREAVRQGASHIHLEPHRKSCRVRLSIDGLLTDFMRPPAKLRSALVNQIMTLAKLDVSKTGVPQTGSAKIRLDGKTKHRLSVSVLPTLYGEKVVIRLVDTNHLVSPFLQKLGFEAKAVPLLHFALKKRRGLVIVTGPEAAGKSTTLYSMLMHLNEPGMNLYALEESLPLVTEEGITIVRLDAGSGKTAADLARFIFRNNEPAVLMLGEIRDRETADAAVRGAVEGHLVLAGFAAPTAPEAISWLLAMGLEPYLVASAMNLVVAQRLLRRLCPECRTEVEPEIEDLRYVGVKMEEMGTFPVYKAAGCSACHQAGFGGRMLIAEVMPVQEAMRWSIREKAPQGEIVREALRQGMQTLRATAIEKLKAGVTTITEIATTCP